MIALGPRRRMATRQTSTKTSTALRGQVALVTGATRGIGLALARALAANSCNLILAARDEKALARISRELASAKIKVLTHPCDIRDPHDVDALFRAARRQFKRLDILINNAGIAHTNLPYIIPSVFRYPHDVDALSRAARRQFKRLDILINNAGIAHTNLPVEKLPFPVWKDVLETNLTGTFLVTQAALAIMKRGGTIVNNLSIAATRVFAGSAAYNASKHGALGLTNTLREELRPRGIRVIALLPGATNTDIWTTLWPQAPRKKMMSPETAAEGTLQKSGSAVSMEK